MNILQGIWQIPTLLCLDWNGLDSVSGSSAAAGLDWIRINGSWIWTGLDLSNSIHSILCAHHLHPHPRNRGQPIIHHQNQSNLNPSLTQYYEKNGKNQRSIIGSPRSRKAEKDSTRPHGRRITGQRPALRFPFFVC